MVNSLLFTLWFTFYLSVFQKKINLKKLKNFLYFLFHSFFILSPIIYSTVSITQTDKRTDYPGKQVADKIQYAWNQDHKENHQCCVWEMNGNAGNLSYHLKSRPVWEGIYYEKTN